MIHYDYYADVPQAAIDELIHSSRLARLVTVGDGAPHLGLFPYLPGFSLHLNKTDEQITDLRARPTCLLEIDEVLAAIPSHWLDEHAGGFATAYHRTVAFECTATLFDSPDEIATLQNEFLARYQPEDRHRTVTAADPIYAGMLRALIGVRLQVTKTKVKFKLGQNRSVEQRATVITRLRERGSELDRRTADALQWTIDLGLTTQVDATRRR